MPLTEGLREDTPILSVSGTSTAVDLTPVSGIHAVHTDVQHDVDAALSDRVTPIPKSGEVSQKIVGIRTLYDALIQPKQQGNEALHEAHKLFLEALYPEAFLRLFEEMRIRGYDQNVHTQQAIDALENIMQTVDQEAMDRDSSFQDAFLRLYHGAANGENDFLMRLRRTKVQAAAAIQHARMATVNDPLLAMEMDATLMEYEEGEHGLEFPDHFAEKMTDPHTKAVVVSLDFNSTFNVNESYSPTQLVAQAHRQLEQFAREFRSKFPDKELYLTLNTGRPGMYAWGVMEAGFPSVPELRKVAVAESGGVILNEGMHKGEMQVALENPQQWQNELANIREYLLQNIANPKNVVIEPKLSMLSIKIGKEGDYGLTSTDGTPVTPEWIQAQLKAYFEKTEDALNEEFETMVHELSTDIPAVLTLVDALKGPQGKIVNGDKMKALTELDSIIDSFQQHHQDRIAEIKARLATLELMDAQGLLQPNYNPTAGYIDIGHAHLNKYSTLMRHVCVVEELTPEEVLYVQIGDSTTDIIPDKLTGKGEPNEGANNAYLIAVRDSNQKLLSAVEKRDEYGMTTLQPSILAVTAMFKGLEKVVKASA